MGVVSVVTDLAVAVFSLTIAVAAPLMDAQTVLPPGLHPAPLVELKRWYDAEYGDYLMARPPGFFRGIICLELAFQWPLAVATLYGILTRRRWVATTSLMTGVSTLTSMVLISYFFPLPRSSGVSSAAGFREICVSPLRLCSGSRTLVN